MDENGVAILVTVILMLVVSLLGATVVTLGRIDYDISAHFRASTSARHLADAGLEATVADLRSDFLADPLDNWVENWLDTGTSPPVPLSPFPDVDGAEINSFTMTPLSLDPNPYPGTPYALGDPVALGEGTFSRIVWLPPIVSISPNGGNAYRVEVRVRSTGTDPGAAAPSSVPLDALVGIDIASASPYDNALLLGSGEGDELLSGGRVRVAGSIHAFGGPRSRMRFHRSSQVNHYDGIDQSSGFGSLASKIPAIGTVDHGGETVSTLNATFRLKEGRVQLTGTSRLGEPDSSGDATKETLDAVYSDGKITPGPKVHADYEGSYDLDPDLAFPRFSDPYTDLETGVGWASYSTWLDAHSFTPPVGGDLVIQGGTPSFSYVDPQGRGSIAWDADAQILTIDGIIKVNGRAKLGEAGGGSDALSEVEYRGTGVIYATDRIEIHNDLYPVGQYLSDGPDPDTLVDGNLGLITPEDILMVSGLSNPNMRVMAALYAEREVRISERANIAGAVVTNYMDLSGAGMVRFWHVPHLGRMFPRGLPTGEMVPSISGFVRDWYENR